MELDALVFQLIEDNLVAVAISSFLILFVFTNNNFDRKTNRLFLTAAFCILILIVEEAWEAQLALRAVYQPMRVPLSALGYTLRPAIPYCLTHAAKRYSKKQCIALSIPVLLNALISFSALFCDISFSYTADNQFVRGPLGLSPFLVAAFYIGLILAHTIRDCRKGGLTEALILSAMVLLAFLSTVLESLFHFRSIQNPCMATSITFFYLFLHSNQSNRDVLTGALTRRRFYFDAAKYNTSLSAVISLDLNDLKTLNDQFGHVAGDKALVSVTDSVKRHMSTRASLYRTGGDEFMILCYKHSEADVQALIGKIRATLDSTPYRCAIGYAMYSYSSNFDAVCHAADEVMYQNKRQLKGADAAQRV